MTGWAKGGTLEGVSQPVEPVPVEVTFAVDWSAASGLPVQPANQFLTQMGPPVDGKPDGIHLVLGFLAPPIIVSSDRGTQQGEIEALGGKISVDVHGRYYMTRERLGELLSLLQIAAEQYDEVVKGEKE